MQVVPYADKYKKDFVKNKQLEFYRFFLKRKILVEERKQKMRLRQAEI